jgi:hypothetical protein
MRVHILLSLLSLLLLYLDARFDGVEQQRFSLAEVGLAALIEDNRILFTYIYIYIYSCGSIEDRQNTADIVI